MSLYAYYEDSGPAHPGAQDMARTAPWYRLYIFDDYQTFRRWEQSEEFEKMKSRRRNARFYAIFSAEDEDVGGVVDMRPPAQREGA